MKRASQSCPFFTIDSLPGISYTSARERIRYIEIKASKPNVFIWLSQLRLAPYSYDFIDNRSRKSPHFIVRNLPPLKNKHHILLAFHVHSFEENTYLACRFCEPINYPLNLYLRGLYLEYRLVDRGNTTELWCKIKGFVNRGVVSRTAFLMICSINRFMMKRQLRTIKKLAEDLAAGRIETMDYPLEKSYIKSGFHWWIFCRRRQCPSVLTSKM